MMISDRKIRKIFARTQTPIEPCALTELLKQNLIPAPSATSGRKLSWNQEQLPYLGEKLGFLKKPTSPQVVTIFMTKGGVLKSTLSLHLARIAALHNISTLVIGLDLQGDITRTLQPGDDDDASLNDTLRQKQSPGLYDFMMNQAGLLDLIQKTDIPTLDFIPEAPELLALDVALIGRPRRESWLTEKLVRPLKKKYDLIIFDCSPNWNQLTTNALVAADLVISPIECRIHNFRNLSLFEKLIEQSKEDLQLNFRQIYLATKVSLARKLSREILDWYQANLDNCLKASIRESAPGEESIAMGLSCLEHLPESSVADDWRMALQEIWAHLPQGHHQPRKQGIDLWPSA